MEEIIYDKNSDNDIKDLKENLMNLGSHSNSSSKIISDTVRQVINEEIGKIFENNLIELLQSQLKWTIGGIPRTFFYRELLVGSKIEIVSSFQNKIIKFGDIDYVFQILDDESIKIQDVNANENEIIIPKGEKKTVTHSLTNTKIIVSVSKKIEMDGSFNITNFSLNSFNHDEIVVYYNGISDFSPYNYAIIEAKLSQKKIKEMIAQLKKDKFVTKKISDKNILFIGFINSDHLEDDISKEIAGCNLLILGIKNSHLFKREVTKYYDWELIKEIKNEINDIKNEINNIKNEISGIKDDIKEMRNHFDNKFEELKSLIKGKGEIETEEITQNQFLNLKRERP